MKAAIFTVFVFLFLVAWNYTLWSPTLQTLNDSPHLALFMAATNGVICVGSFILMVWLIKNQPKP